jgi:hypothetical protein
MREAHLFVVPGSDDETGWRHDEGADHGVGTGAAATQLGETQRPIHVVRVFYHFSSNSAST